MYVEDPFERKALRHRINLEALSVLLHSYIGARSWLAQKGRLN